MDDATRPRATHDGVIHAITRPIYRPPCDHSPQLLSRAPCYLPSQFTEFGSMPFVAFNPILPHHFSPQSTHCAMCPFAPIHHTRPFAPNSPNPTISPHATTHTNSHIPPRGTIRPSSSIPPHFAPRPFRPISPPQTVNDAISGRSVVSPRAPGD